MTESTIQLPPNSTGALVRTEAGDGVSGQIPSGVVEEVVILSDAQGALPGDARQQPLAVVDQETIGVLGEISRTLARIELLLSAGFDNYIDSDETIL